ncbi:class I SAM-dependent methyltransferase [Muricomes intestini]|uniref:class I SAM-dependent methyltransferase n=1 Tax=Muricomes intestini TaxID=1796634 RepID=UPI002FE01F45
MGTVKFENNTFIYTDGVKSTSLLNCSDFLSNKSRIPLHSLGNGLNVPLLISKLMEVNKPLSAGTGEEAFALSNLLLDVLVSSHLVKTPLPVKALEIGTVTGVTTYHLASLLGKFHPDSLLCCVSDSIGNESGNQWLNRIVLVEEPPRLSFLAADYHDTNLQESSFDIIVINGIVSYENPYEIVSEAKRLVKNGGLILCYSVENPALEQSFKKSFPKVTEYPLTGSANIITVQVDKTRKTEALYKPMEEIYRYIKETEQTIYKNAEININFSLNKIQEHLETAAKEQDTTAKIRLIELRESLIEYALF